MTGYSQTGRWSRWFNRAVPSPSLADVLAALRAAGLEPGAAVCAIDGAGRVEEAVVGDRGDGSPWTSETLAMTYSCAKPLAALTVLEVVASGALGLDQRVAEVWPEYAVHGKHATTVRHVLSHQAGVAVFPDAARDIAYDDRDALVALLAAAAPAHEPGTAVAEHALTYGHLCDEIVRRVTGDALDARFARLADRFGWDLHLSVPETELSRVADVVPVVDDWPARYLGDERWGPALGRPAGVLDPAQLNSTRWRRTCFAAISLHASAAGLARFYADLVPTDGLVATLLGHELHTEYLRPQRIGHDGVLDREVAWTLGFQVDATPRGGTEIGMGGAGGSSGWVTVDADGEVEYAAAYVSRGLGNHDRDERAWQVLEARCSPVIRPGS